MTFEVTILGSNSALPAHGRHPTSQVINNNEKLFLVDCGEGTQILLHKYHIKFSRIEHVFISHLHGDHFFGLIGLITSYHLNHRDRPLTIFAPEGLEEIIYTQLKYSGTQLNYKLIFEKYEPKTGQKIFENEFLEVETIELKHRLPCAGFVFKEKVSSERKVRKDKIEELKIPVEEIIKIKQGADLTLPDGNHIPNKDLTLDPLPPRVYAYCTDTAYMEDFIPFIQNADLLYHEATFAQSCEQRAKETFHSTTIQAATIAKKANVKQLIIGHFSARYRSLDKLAIEARSVFPNTHLALEGASFAITHD